MLLWLLNGRLTAQSTGEAGKPCPNVVSTLATEFIYHVPAVTLPRIEVRHCSGGGDKLQLLAWRRDAATPALSVDTEDFGVVQVAARDNVFVVETSGATTNTVFVVNYERGEPKLIFRRVTHETATILVSPEAIELGISGLSPLGQPERTEKRRFPLDPHGLDPTRK